MQQILTYFFLVVYSITILGIILVIITENRNPLKTLPWIIVLVFAPVVGLVFYFFFGQNLSKQRIISRRTRKRITMQLEEALRRLLTLLAALLAGVAAGLIVPVLAGFGERGLAVGIATTALILLGVGIRDRVRDPDGRAGSLFIGAGIVCVFLLIVVLV